MNEPVRGHRCAASACTTMIGMQLLMCARHWKMVPRSIADRLLSAYVRGQSISTATPAYLEAMQECIDAVAMREGRLQRKPKPIGQADGDWRPGRHETRPWTPGSDRDHGDETEAR